MKMKFICNLALASTVIFFVSCQDSSEDVTSINSVEENNSEDQTIDNEINTSDSIKSENSMEMKNNVVNYFNDFAKSDNFFPIPYSIKNIDGKWIASSEEIEKTGEAKVDIKNGFISFKNLEAANSQLDYNFVIYNTSKKSPIVGITLETFDGIFFEKEVKFYEKKNDSWEDITKDVLPAYSYKNFFTTLDDEINSLSGSYKYFVELPQNGTTAKVYLRISEACEQGGDCNNPENKSLFCQKRKRVMEKSSRFIELNWNKNTGSYSI